MAKKFKVKAECHDDEHACEVSFDVAPWLKKARVDQIAALARCEWGGDYPADQVALDMAKTVEDIKYMFKYIEARNKVNKEHIGFECHVDEAQALAWLKAHRPKAHAAAVKAVKEAY